VTPVSLPVTETEEYGAHGVLRPELAEPRPRDLCTDCGISRSSDPRRCGRACQFIHPRYPELERRVHGRSRDEDRPDEIHFGPFRRMVRARLNPGLPGSQWTGIATRLGERLLSRGRVDAVLTTASEADDRWAPRPVLVTRAEGMRQCRGMKMGFSPILALLDDVERLEIRRLAVIGIPCQVHALRVLEEELELDELYVVGTPCSDNTTTERFHRFLELLSDRPDAIRYLEFRADYRVEIRYEDGTERYIPFPMLPIAELPDDFIPLTCRSCADYTNVLADLTVGYMAGEGDQWLVVRNARGEELVELLGPELESGPVGSSGDRRRPVAGFLQNLRRAVGGLPVRRAPRWLRPVIGWAMRWLGPKGLEFARARVEMKALEAIETLRRQRPRRLLRMVPDHVWRLAADYGVHPEDHERPMGTAVGKATRDGASATGEGRPIEKEEGTRRARRARDTQKETNEHETRAGGAAA